jgi:hypothetical protein
MERWNANGGGGHLRTGPYSDRDPSSNMSLVGAGERSFEFVALDIFVAASGQSPVMLYPLNNFVENLGLIIAEIKCRILTHVESGAHQFQCSTLHHREQIEVNFDWADDRGSRTCKLSETNPYDLIEVGRDCALYLRREEIHTKTTIQVTDEWSRLGEEAKGWMSGKLSGIQKEIASKSFFLPPRPT